MKKFISSIGACSWWAVAVMEHGGYDTNLKKILLSLGASSKFSDLISKYRMAKLACWQMGYKTSLSTM